MTECAKSKKKKERSILCVGRNLIVRDGQDQRELVQKLEIDRLVQVEERQRCARRTRPDFRNQAEQVHQSRRHLSTHCNFVKQNKINTHTHSNLKKKLLMK